MAATVTATYAKNHLGEILRRVDAGKEMIVIERNGEAVAVLAPVSGAAREAMRNEKLLALAGALRLSNKEADAWTDEVRSRRTASKRWKEAQR